MEDAYIKQLKNIRRCKTYLTDTANFIFNKCDDLGTEFDESHIRLLDNIEGLIIELEFVIRALELLENCDD